MDEQIQSAICKSNQSTKKIELISGINIPKNVLINMLLGLPSIYMHTLIYKYIWITFTFRTNNSYRQTHMYIWVYPLLQFRTKCITDRYIYIHRCGCMKVYIQTVTITKSIFSLNIMPIYRIFDIHLQDSFGVLFIVKYTYYMTKQNIYHLFLGNIYNMLCSSIYYDYVYVYYTFTVFCVLFYVRAGT